MTPKQTPAPRYAVYYVPAAGTPLASFGARWLGYDIQTGARVPRERLGLDPELADRIVAAPAVYGFHATLKSPFRLRGGVSPDVLVERLKSIARSRERIGPVRLAVSRLGRFLALRPDHGGRLRQLSCQCTMALEPFRAPINDRERRHRLKANLSPYQRILFQTYGYPYVFDEFHFHLSLTGPLGETERDQAEPVLHDALADLTAEPIEISSICLAVQPEPGAPFRVQAGFAFCA